MVGTCYSLVLLWRCWSFPAQSGQRDCPGMALLEQSLQRPNVLRRLRFPALKGSSRSCRISGAGNDAWLAGGLECGAVCGRWSRAGVLAFSRVGCLLVPTILGLVLAPVWIAPVGSLGQGKRDLESTSYYPRLRGNPIAGSTDELFDFAIVLAGTGQPIGGRNHKPMDDDAQATGTR